MSATYYDESEFNGDVTFHRRVKFFGGTEGIEIGLTGINTTGTSFFNQINASGIITASSFVKNGATPTNFLKAGGSDSALLSSDVTGALGYTPANSAVVSGQYPIGNSIILDNFSSSFNGSNTDFTLATAGIAFTPTGSSANLVVSIGGIIQKPGTDYSIVQVGGSNTNTIRFTTAPTSGLDCFVVGLGGQGALLSDISWNAKGDLVVATGDNVASILNVGSNNSILIADSSAASGVKWGSSINTLTFTDSVKVGTGVTILPSGINVNGVITATSFVGDGSALTNLIGVGAGVIVKDDGITVGTTGTIDFGSNLSVSALSAGAVIVTASSSGIAGIDTSGTSTFTNLNVTGVSTFAGITTVTGTTLFAKQLNVSGVVTASSFSGSASGLTNIPAGQLTGNLPAIDGSALIGVVGSGSGIVVKDSGTTVGTAGTIDFGDNLTVSTISAGIVTVSSSGGGGSFVTTAAGIHTLSSVGIGTTNPNAVASSSNATVLSAGIVTAYKYYGDGSNLTGTTPWASTSAGINTLSSVGIGTTNPQAKLQVVGDAILGQVKVTSSGIVTSSNPGIVTYFGDGGNLTFKLNSTGSTSRSIVSKQADVVSVKDFGAVGDGSTNDTSAFQAALNASQNVYVPPGEYLITSTLSIPDRNTSIFGSGMGVSVIVAGPSFTDSLFQVAGGGYFTSHDRVFSAKDLSVLTKSGGSSAAYGTAFNLKWPSKPTATGSEYYPASDGSSANLQYRRKIRARFESVTIAQYSEGTSASPSNQGWSNGIIFENCCYAMVTNCSLTGHGTGSSSGSTAQKAFLNAISLPIDDVGEYPAASESACTVSQNGIIWKGTQSCVELWVTNCAIHRWNYGVVVQGQAEGVYINNGSFVVCGTGVYWSTDNRKPNLFINATHMSVFNGAVVTSNVEEIFISNCLFYIHQQANGATSLIDLTHTINTKIVNNIFRSRSNYDHIAIALKSNYSSPPSIGTQYVLISGNTIGGSSEGAIDSLSGGIFTPGSDNARFHRVLVCQGDGLFTNIKVRDNQYIGYINGFADLSNSATGNVSFDGVEGVLVSNSDATADAGAFSISNESETVITWDSTTRETGRSEPQSGGTSYPPGGVGTFPAQWFSTSLSSSRVYIPFGVTRVKITAQVAWQANGSGYRRIYFKKNGTANFIGNSIITHVPVQNSGTPPPVPSGSASHETFMTISTPVIPVSGGNYFELYVWQNCGSTLSLNKRNWKTWMSIEKVG